MVDREKYQPSLVTAKTALVRALCVATHLVAGKTCKAISTKRSGGKLQRGERLNRSGDNLIDRVDQQATRLSQFSSVRSLIYLT